MQAFTKRKRFKNSFGQLRQSLSEFLLFMSFLLALGFADDIVVIWKFGLVHNQR